MKTMLVASSKGGVGKTTIATHLAAHSALDGQRTVLVDADPQDSSTRWAERRAELESAVLPLDGTAQGLAQAVARRRPAGGDRCPGRRDGRRSRRFLEHADAVVVPVLPSALDIEATVPFLDSLAKHPRVRKGQLRVGLVGNSSSPGPMPRSRRWSCSRPGRIRWSRSCATARPTWCWPGWARACSTTTPRRCATTRTTGSLC